MPASRDEDLDWLYRREPKPGVPDPESTRVMPPVDEAPPTRVSPPVPPQVQPAPRVQPPPRVQPAPPPTPPMGPPLSARGPSRRPRRRRTGRRVLAGVGLLLALLLIGLVAVPAYAWSRVERVDATPAGDRPDDQPGTTFLFVGSDSREGLTEEERKELGTGSTAGSRTDTIMLVSIPPSGRPALISLPRDSFVAIPGKGENKINAAYALGGPELLVQTVEAATDLRIDGYAEIGFGGFVNVIDAVGGIRMCLPEAIEDRDSNLDLPAGCQTLGGADALGYVRMRKADNRGDLGRVERQREMLGAVAAKAASPATLLNPVRYFRVATATADAVRLGEDTSFRQTASLALAMRKIAGGDGLTLTVPVANPDASTSAGSAVLWDEAKAEEMFGDVAAGDTSELERFAR